MFETNLFQGYVPVLYEFILFINTHIKQIVLPNARLILTRIFLFFVMFYKCNLFKFKHFLHKKSQVFVRLHLKQRQFFFNNFQHATLNISKMCTLNTTNLYLYTYIY